MTTTPEIQAEIEKAASLVAAARRLLATGTMVDLSALEGKVRLICDGAAEIGPDCGPALLPGMETLMGELDRLARSLEDHAPEVSP